MNIILLFLLLLGSSIAFNIGVNLLAGFELHILIRNAKIPFQFTTGSEYAILLILTMFAFAGPVMSVFKKIRMNKKQ